MSKILVVEPYRILQRAIALNFFPQYQVEVTEQVPQMSALEGRSYDVAIIDAAALREKNPTADLNRPVRDWPIPIIWLEENVSTAAPIRDKLVVLHKPIARNDLLAALARCRAQASTISLTDGGEKLSNETNSADTELKSDSEHRAQIIDLVDVVEEEATGRERDAPPERKKQ